MLAKNSNPDKPTTFKQKKTPNGANNKIAKKPQKTNTSKNRGAVKTGRSTKTSFLQKRIPWYVLLALIIVPAAIYVTFTIYRNNQAESVRIEHLKQAGIALDKVQQSLAESGIDAQVKRLSYCWRTGEKTGPGVRYCDQRLVVYGANKSETEQYKAINQTMNSLGTITDSSIIRNLLPKAFKNDNLQVGANISGGALPKKECGVQISAFSPNYGISVLDAKYVIDINCGARITSGDIYQKGDRLGAMVIFEGAP